MRRIGRRTGEAGFFVKGVPWKKKVGRAVDQLTSDSRLLSWRSIKSPSIRFYTVSTEGVAWWKASNAGEESLDSCTIGSKGILHRYNVSNR